MIELKRAPLRFLERTVLFFLCTVAFLYALVYVVLALQRMPYPFENEWLESGTVVMVQRVLDGQPIYAPPSLDFLAMIYTPLYYYTSALIALVVGNGFLPLRLVSFAASIGSAVLIFLIVRRRTSSPLASFLAACLFLATFRVSGAFLDIARVDSQFLFFLLAGLYAFDASGKLTRSVVAPLLLFLAAFTKQPALTVALGLSASAFLTRQGIERLAFPLLFGAAFGASYFFMNAYTDGWYKYFVFTLPLQHEFYQEYIVRFWTRDIMQEVGIALGFCICAVWSEFRSRAGFRGNSRVIVDACILGSLFAASYMARIHAGGYSNVLMPVYAGLAIYCGVGFNFLLNATRQGLILRIGILLALMLQFILLFYWPQWQVSTSADRERGEEVMQRISGIDGEVFWFDHPWYARSVGKSTHVQDLNILKLAPGAVEWVERLSGDFAKAIAEKRYAALIADFEELQLPVPNLLDHYELVDSDLSGPLFRPITGWDRRPQYLYIRRP